MNRPPPGSGHVSRPALTLLLCALSLVVGLLLAESILRLLGYGDAIQYDYVDELGWVHQPNQHARTVGGWTVRIDSAGLRGPEYARVKGPGVFRILLVGDSFTFGYGVAEDSTYGAQLQRLLRDGGASCGTVQVINGGVNGYNTDQEVAFVRRVGSAFRPDVVVLGFNPNDIMAPAEGKTMLHRPGLKKLLGRSALYQFLVPRIKAVVLRQAGEGYDSTIARFIAGDRSVDDRAERVGEAIEILHALAAEHSFKLVVAVFPFATQVYGTAGDWPPSVFRRLEATSNIPILDVLPALRSAAREGRSLFLDEPTRHPNPQGLHIVAGELQRLLQSRGLLPACSSSVARLPAGASVRGR